MNMWNQEFDCEEYVYGEEANDFLKAHYQALPKGRILCLAEGEGRNAVFLARQGYDATAVDFSEVGLKKTHLLAGRYGVSVECICADLAHFEISPQQWDGIVSISCHLPSSVRQPLYQRVMNGLKPQGVFLIEGYTPEQLNYKTGGPPEADMMTSAATLKEELNELEFIFLEEKVRELQEGRNHSGLSAVVRGIARPVLK